MPPLVVWVPDTVVVVAPPVLVGCKQAQVVVPLVVAPPAVGSQTAVEAAAQDPVGGV